MDAPLVIDKVIIFIDKNFTSMARTSVHRQVGHESCFIKFSDLWIWSNEVYTI